LAQAVIIVVMKQVYRLLSTLYRRPEWIWLPLLAIGFFLLAASYNYTTQDAGFVKWISPDENANYLFAKQYAENGTLMFWEKYNLLGQGIVMPRSFRSDGALLKPVSFLGLPIIYGTIAKGLGAAALPYITPVLAAIGLIFFFLLVARLFDRRVAAVATVILAFFPVYIYFSSHSFFHNVPFVVFFLIGLYLALRFSDYPDFSQTGRSRPYLGWLLSAVSGVFIGLAVATRTSELLWLAPLFIVLWLFNLRRVGLVKLIFFLFFAVVAYSPVFFWNQVLYNSPLASGYPNMDKSVSAIVSTGRAAVASVVKAPVTIAQNRVEAGDYLEKLNSAIFVFGFRPDHSFKMSYYYFWKMFPWLIIMTVLGFACWLANWRRRRFGQLIYILCLLIIAPILIFYYGSWIFYDNPDPNSFTIGNSYTRYWLPLYLGMIPLAAYAIVCAAKLGYKPAIRSALRWSTVAIIAAWSIFFVYYGSDEGLAYSASRQLASRQEWKSVLDLTPANSVIVTRYQDKLFFPQRMVIVGLLTDINMNNIYAKLAARIPVYYYNFKLSDADLVYLNTRKLKDSDLIIVKIANINETFTLYRLYSRSKTR